MKISIEKIKQIPKEISDTFGMCVYGSPSEEMKEWILFHQMKVEQSGPHCNIFTDKNINDLFLPTGTFQYLDGFSPNLNKHLHIGHFSNLIFGKAFQALGLANKTVAILGDTLEGETTKEEALAVYHNYCKVFNYQVDEQYMASEMSLPTTFLEAGQDSYLGAMVFDVQGKKIVGIKSNGSTSYFYQDVALAHHLGGSVLYLTGNEQNPHFTDLKKLLPNTHHVGLGLVKANGGKMSSRLGNVIWMKDVLDMLCESFNGDLQLSYNVFAGLILKTTPKSDKNIDMDLISNPLNSPGLYLSYTLAKLKSAGVPCVSGTSFKSQELQFKHMKAKNALMPNILFEGLVDHAKKISALYVTHIIKNNPENQKMFEVLGSDLTLGMQLLGLFNIEKV